MAKSHGLNSHRERDSCAGQRQVAIRLTAPAAGAILGIETIGSKGLGRLAPDAPNARRVGDNDVEAPETDPNNPPNGSANAPNTDAEAGTGSGARTPFQPDPNIKDIPPSAQAHIIDGEINKKGKAVGGHNSNSPNLRIDRSTVSIDEGGSGVFEAQVSVRGPDGQFLPKKTNGGKSTFFPETWDSNRILNEIQNATRNPAFPNDDSKFITPTGVKVTIFKNDDGTVRSAFPDFPQDPK